MAETVKEAATAQVLNLTICRMRCRHTVRLLTESWRLASYPDCSQRSELGELPLNLCFCSPGWQTTWTSLTVLSFGVSSDRALRLPCLTNVHFVHHGAASSGTQGYA